MSRSLARAPSSPRRIPHGQERVTRHKPEALALWLESELEQRVVTIGCLLFSHPDSPSSLLRFLGLDSRWNNLQDQILLLPQARPQKGTHASPLAAPAEWSDRPALGNARGPCPLLWVPLARSVRLRPPAARARVSLPRVAFTGSPAGLALCLPRRSWPRCCEALAVRASCAIVCPQPPVGGTGGS